MVLNICDAGFDSINAESLYPSFTSPGNITDRISIIGHNLSDGSVGILDQGPRLISFFPMIRC